MTTDLLAAALAQLASIMAANWTLTEALGSRISLGKFWISLVLAPLLSTSAWALGWFSALPAATTFGAPITGLRGAMSAAFAGLIGAVLTSTAHKAFIGARTPKE